MASDLSLIPQNRIKDLSTTFDGCVHKTGNETISGIKTFTDTPTIKMTQPNLNMQYSGISKGTAPTSTLYGWFGTVLDKNGPAQANKMAQIYHQYDPNGRSSLNLQVFEPTSGATNGQQLSIGYDANKNIFTSAPTPAASNSTSSANIATVGWVNNPATSTNVVHRSGNETIDGTKTFVGNTNDALKMIISNTSGQNCRLQLRDSTTTYGDSGIEIFQATSNNFNQFLIHFMNGNQFPFHIDQDASDSSIFNTYINNKRLASFVTTTYQSGTSWYRVWSDGWIEQGGRGDLAECASTAFTLHKPFKDTNYFVCASQYNVSTAGDTEMGVGAAPSSTTQFNAFCHYINPNTMNFMWYACGY